MFQAHPLPCLKIWNVLLQQEGVVRMELLLGVHLNLEAILQADQLPRECVTPLPGQNVLDQERQASEHTAYQIVSLGI